MKKNVPQIQDFQKDSSDLPVVLVALGAAVCVMVLVALFLVYLPNRNVAKILRDQESKLLVIYVEKQNIANNLKTFQNELKQIEKDLVELGGVFLIDPKDLRDELPKTFLENGFLLETYQMGMSHAAPEGPKEDRKNDRWWLTNPIEFAVTGLESQLPGAIREFRKKIPITVRLLEVDIKRGKSDEKVVDTIFQLSAYYLTPLSKMPKNYLDESEQLKTPKPGFFESGRMQKLRAEIERLKNNIYRLDDVVGEVAKIQMNKNRLRSALFRKAEYSAQKEREFDLLETQLQSALKKVNSSDVERIIIKIENTEVSKNSN